MESLRISIYKKKCILITPYRSVFNFRKDSCRIKWLYSWKRIQSNLKLPVKIWCRFFCKKTSHFEFEGKSRQIETITWSEFLHGEKVTAEKIPGSIEIIKSKRARLWVSQLGIQVGKLIICVRLFQIKKIII